MESSDKIDRARERLLKGHDPDERAVWRILGEDTNCDLGGSHTQPELIVLTGRYASVVDHALRMPRFFAWGYGGDVEKVTVGTVDDSKRITELKDEQARLRRRLHEVGEELAVLSEND